ncbi:MAG: hypothetical protein ACTSR2_11615, partial [Candidatus Hodarchaeales archaeon]
AEGSFTLLAVEWHAGPSNLSKAIWSGEAIFADYKNMFGKISEKGTAELQSITLIRNMLNWTHLSTNSYYDEVWAEDITPPSLVALDTNIREGAVLYDNEELEVTFTAYDWGQSLWEFSSVEVLYTINDGDETSATVDQLSYSDFAAAISDFAAGDEVSFYVKVTDRAGFTATSSTYTFSVLYSDTVGPQIDTPIITPSSDITPSTVVTVTVNVTDVAGASEVVSGLSVITAEYSTDGGTTWVSLTMDYISGTTYTADLPTFEDGTSVTVRVYAEDMAGNSATSTTLTFDVAAPVTTTTTTTTTTTITPTTTTTTKPTPGFSLVILLMSFVAVAVFLRKDRR